MVAAEVILHAQPWQCIHPGCCWQGGFTEDLCCNSTGCWDHVYTKATCCEVQFLSVSKNCSTHVYDIRPLWDAPYDMWYPSRCQGRWLVVEGRVLEDPGPLSAIAKGFDIQFCVHEACASPGNLLRGVLPNLMRSRYPEPLSHALWRLDKVRAMQSPLQVLSDMRHSVRNSLPNAYDIILCFFGCVCSLFPASLQSFITRLCLTARQNRRNSFADLLRCLGICSISVFHIVHMNNSSRNWLDRTLRKCHLGNNILITVTLWLTESQLQSEVGCFVKLCRLVVRDAWSRLVALGLYILITHAGTPPDLFGNHLQPRCAAQNSNLFKLLAAHRVHNGCAGSHMFTMSLQCVLASLFSHWAVDVSKRCFPAMVSFALVGLIVALLFHVFLSSNNIQHFNGVEVEAVVIIAWCRTLQFLDGSRLFHGKKVYDMQSQQRPHSDVSQESNPGNRGRGTEATLISLGCLLCSVTCVLESRFRFHADFEDPLNLQKLFAHLPLCSGIWLLLSLSRSPASILRTHVRILSPIVCLIGMRGREILLMEELAISVHEALWKSREANALNILLKLSLAVAFGSLFHKVVGTEAVVRRVDAIRITIHAKLRST